PNPATKLEVQGDIRARSTDLNNAPAIHFNANPTDSSTDFKMLNRFNAPAGTFFLDFARVNGTNYMTIRQDNGNIGVGTTNPTARLHVIGNFIATGSKSALVETPSYGKRQIYAVESPENWFEDFGKAKLSDGQAVVKLDSIFAETVNTENDYHIFLTPQGDCEGLYVANKTVASFEVRELRKGKSAIEFDYRIIAKRKGFEQVRLEEVMTPELKEEKK
ncbi:MAG: hypothetical protein HYR55_07745, partial [Acidobacteria bacterium]|nr:hypothetical protein [Acidobacteriota bacterium]